MDDALTEFFDRYYKPNRLMHPRSHAKSFDIDPDLYRRLEDWGRTEEAAGRLIRDESFAGKPMMINGCTVFPRD